MPCRAAKLRPCPQPRRDSSCSRLPLGRVQLALPTSILSPKGQNQFSPPSPFQIKVTFCRTQLLQPLPWPGNLVWQCIGETDPDCNPALETSKSVFTLQFHFAFHASPILPATPSTSAPLCGTRQGPPHATSAAQFSARA